MRVWSCSSKCLNTVRFDIFVIQKFKLSSNRSSVILIKIHPIFRNERISWEKKRFVLITLSKHCLPGVNIFESPSSNYEIFTLNKMQEQQYENVNNSSVNSMFTCQPLREKCPNRSFFWSLFRHFSHSERVTTTEYCREYMCSDARSLLIMFLIR